MKRRSDTLTITAAVIIFIILATIAVILPPTTSAASRCDGASTAIDDQGAFDSASALISCSTIVTISSRISHPVYARRGVSSLDRSSSTRARTIISRAVSVPPCRDGDASPPRAVEVLNGASGVVCLFEFGDSVALDFVGRGPVKRDIAPLDFAKGLQQTPDRLTDGIVGQLGKEDGAVWRDDGSILNPGRWRLAGRVLRHVGSCNMMAVGVCWGCSVAHDVLVMRWGNVDVDVSSISVLTVIRRDRSSSVRQRHEVRSADCMRGC